MLAKRFSQSVHFASDIGERIGIAAVAAADGVVAFPERGEQIRQGLKGEDNALSKFGYHSQPEADDHDRQRPLGSRRERAGPDQDQRRRDGRSTGEQRHQENAPVVAQPRLRLELGFFRPGFYQHDIKSRNAAFCGKARFGSIPAPWPPG